MVPSRNIFQGPASHHTAARAGWGGNLSEKETADMRKTAHHTGLSSLLCAVLIDQLKSAFAFIKKHYRVINMVCGIFLILIGILMMTGIFSKITAALA